MYRKIAIKIYTYIFIIICLAGCSRKEEYMYTNSDIFMSTSTNSTIDIDNTFSIILIDGVECAKSDKNEIVFTENNKIYGGIRKYEKPVPPFPEITRSNQDCYLYLSEIGLEVPWDELTAHTICTGLYDGWEVWLHSDEIDITHNLFPHENWIYDIWFDTSKEENLKYKEIFETLIFVE